jgi:hypothetical protein
LKKNPQNSSLSRNFPAASVLSVSAIAVIIVLGFGTTTLLGIASAQTGNNATTAGATNASKLMGDIGSLQLDENGNPAWITAGDWTRL